MPLASVRVSASNLQRATHLLWFLVKPFDTLHQGRLFLFRALESARVIDYVWGRTSRDIRERKSIE